MYKAILLGVVVLSGVCMGQGVTCPGVDPTNTTVMLPNPQNCTKFFMCQHGQAIPMSCSWGTYFNANKSVCDWPADSGCVQPDPPTVCNPADLVPLYPVPGNCSAFISCSGDQQFKMACPAGLHFSPSLKVCVWPKDSGCVQPDPPTVCNPADLVPLYPVPGNCSAFISCSGDKQFKMACPAGLHFSPSLKVCVWPKDSDCVQPTSTPVPESTTAIFNEATVTPVEATTQLPVSDSTAADNVC